MQTVLIVIHFLIVISLVCVVLIQPSEGGGLGVSSGSGLMKTRGSKNALTRLTAILAICFFAVSIGLIVVGNISNSDILKRIPISSEKDPVNQGNAEIAPLSNSESTPSVLEQSDSIAVPAHEENKSTVPVIESPVPLLPKK
ncbi:preprotein translocase subunit SecG [Bartonella sp. B10]